LLNNFIVTKFPSWSWNAEMFFILQKTFRYAVAGYGGFSCVKGGVSRKTVDDK